MRILMPSIVDPAESRGGGWTVTKGLIEAMRIAWPGCEVICIAVSSGGRAAHRLRQAKSVLGSVVIGGLPAKMRFTRTRAMRRDLRESLSAPAPDLIMLNGGDLLWMLGELPPGVPVIVVAQNLEHVLYERQIGRISVTSRMARRVLAADSRRLRNLELEGLRTAAAVIFLSEADRRAALELLPALNAIVIPPSFGYEPAQRRKSSGGRMALGMFADFEWWPNRISLDWFLTEIWPSVSSHCDLHLMGHGSGSVARGLSGITRHGFMATAREAFALCDLMIAPIIDGAGVNVKVAEALYNGVPVVATPAAVRGICSASNPALKVCANAAEWIELLTGPVAGNLARANVPPEVQAALSVHAAARELFRFVGETVRS